MRSRLRRTWTIRVVLATLAAAILAAAAIAYVFDNAPGRRYSFRRSEDYQIHKARQLLQDRIAADGYPPSLDGIVGLRDDYGSEIEITVIEQGTLNEQGIALRSPGRDKVLGTVDDWVTFVRRYPVR